MGCVPSKEVAANATALDAGAAKADAAASGGVAGADKAVEEAATGAKAVETKAADAVKTGAADAKAAEAVQGKKMPIAVVSGGTGFIATYLIKELVSKGYVVKASVRDKANPKSVELLEVIEKLTAGVAGKGSLELFEADLLKDGSFDDAVKGADYLFHVASPFALAVEDGQRDLVDPAVNGTKNVIGAAVKSKDTIKRVVLTSSVAALSDYARTQVPKVGKLYTEADFNVTSKLGVGNPPEDYLVSKVQAELAAIEIAEANGLDMVAILPDFVMGPVLTKGSVPTSTSIGFYKAFMEGYGSSVPPGYFYLTDIRDVVAAHILGAEHPNAKGRYVISNGVATSGKDISDVLNKKWPKLALPEGPSEKGPQHIENTRITRELGYTLTPIDKTLVDMAQSLIDLGVVTVPQ